MRTPRIETITASVKATALISEVLFAAHVTAAMPHNVIPTEINATYAAPVEFNPRSVQNLNVAEPQKLSLREAESKWTRKMERRFEELSIAEAYSAISDRQQTELEDLSFERRRLHHPRTADEILFEYRQRKVTSNLIKAVQAYVKFHDAPNSSRSTAK